VALDRLPEAIRVGGRRQLACSNRQVITWIDVAICRQLFGAVTR
jgi:hypothetical protein